MTMLIALPGNEALAQSIATHAGWQVGRLEVRRFPDGESYLRLHSDVAGLRVALVCTLARPDEQILSLLFAARLVRDMGARSVHLVAPYLAYMRQDCRFHEGEAITSRQFAQLLSAEFDGMVTVDPHLHRYRHLDEIYAIAAVAVEAAPLLADWIDQNVANPIVLGPDSESEQWAGAIARCIGAPLAVFSKSRLGDRDVRISAPDLTRWQGRNAVLVDDVISSATTLAVAAQVVIDQGFGPPTCVAVHGLFAPGAATLLSDLGCRVVTTDTVPHPTNDISLAPLLCKVLSEQVLGIDRPSVT